jgi:hypothetical protein
MARPDMHEVDVEAVDLRRELRQSVELRFALRQSCSAPQ